MNRKELQIQKKNMLTVMQSCGYSVYSITKYSSAVSRFINYVSDNALNVDGYSIEEFIEYSCSIRKHNNPQYCDMPSLLIAYHFCYARNEKEAKKEAKLALKACQNYHVNVIYYDLEYSNYQGNLSNDMYYKIAKAFCDTIEGASYSVGIYANQNWFKTKLTNDGFSAWTLWLANYGSNNGYNNWNNELQYNPFNHVLLHQFTSNAKNGVLKNIEGISSTNLDCSYDHGLISTFAKNNQTNENKSFQVGDKVKVNANSKWYDGQSIASFVFNNEYEIIQINGDRVVIGVNGKVTGAISSDNLY